MNMRRALILFGLAAILVGCLVPVYEQGGTKYLGIRVQGGTYVLFALAVAFAALALKKDEIMWVFGLIFLGWFINDFRLTLEQISNADNAHLSLGWLLLFNGALFLLVTLLLGEDRERIGGLFASLKPVMPLEEDDEGEPLDDNESDEEEDPVTAE